MQIPNPQNTYHLRTMKRGDTIPIDLVIEILSRLPAKSIARCRCVSKLWASTLLNPYFADLFRSRSSSRPPNLLFAVERFDDWCFLTCPNPQNPDDKPWSLAADFHMKFPREFCSHRWLQFCGQASGCILFSQCITFSEEGDETLGICKPSTGQYASLPLPLSKRRDGWKSFLGFDPIDKQFKILYFRFRSYYDEPNQILILGTGSNDSLWRKIDCPFNHTPIRGEGICIDGVLYYRAVMYYEAVTDGKWHSDVIVCFDVRYEKFEVIYTYFLPCSSFKLINHNSKLGVITLDYNCNHDDSGRGTGTWRSLDLGMWVKDVEEPRHKWSQYFNFRWEDEVVENRTFSVVGVTATSEIVLATKDASKPFYVFYINTERNTVQSVEIQGLLQANRFDKRGRAESSRVEVFVDHEEDLKFITMNGATYLSPPEVKRKPRTKSTTSKAHLQQDDRPRFESINKFDSLSLLDGDDECT